MDEMNAMVKRFLDRLPEWARPEATKAIRAAQLDGWAAGVAYAEMEQRMRKMADAELCRDEFNRQRLLAE